MGDVLSLVEEVEQKVDQVAYPGRQVLALGIDDPGRGVTDLVALEDDVEGAGDYSDNLIITSAGGEIYNLPVNAHLRDL